MRIERKLWGDEKDRARTLRAIGRKAARLAKIAEKNGVPAPVIGEPELRRAVVGKTPTGHPITDEVHVVTIDVPEHVCRPGYDLVAIVQGTDAGQDVAKTGARIVTRLKAGEGVDLDPYRAGSLRCDHCQTRRHRKTLLVIREQATERLLTLGVDCAENYVPGGANSAAALEWVIELERDTGGDNTPRGEQTYARDDVLELTALWLAEHPYTKRDGYGLPTVSAIREVYDPPRITRDTPPDEARAIQERAAYWERVTKDDAARAKAAEVVAGVKDWAAVLDPRSDYEHNLKAALSCDYLGRRVFGIAVSAVHVWLRVQERAVAHARGPGKATRHVGQVGERRTWEGVVVANAAYDGNYGTTYRFAVRTDDGGLVLWWASGSRPDANVGDRVALTARVKRLGEYKDEPQTVVTRGKVERLGKAEEVRAA